MKNIHLLPTNNPSKLFIHNAFNDLRFDVEQLKHDNNQHIYITSDEEIKEGDWFIYKNEIIHRDKGKIDSMWVDAVKNGKKIILTTDQDLIKDGIQAISDEFLEWFVKNPSCQYGGYKDIDWDKIITSKEEPKQETLEQAAERMYSEEDLRNAYRWGTTVNHGTKEHFNEWFEQFKKK
jgi:hypothetical protein